MEVVKLIKGIFNVDFLLQSIKTGKVNIPIRQIIDFFTGNVNGITLRSIKR